MSNFSIGLLAGIFIGTMLGIFIMSACFVARRVDDNDKEVKK
ncbi:hypothetical protein [Pectinatus frisingensis]|nr:hypothetical protein [Pectinatus frisingensis]